MRQRKIRLLKGAAVLLGVGLLYALLCRLAGRALVPCLFRLATGFMCPGCGVTHMCLALLRLDFKAAFQANPVVMVLLIPGAVLFFQMARRYLQEGSAMPTRRQSIVLYSMCAALLLFGVLRNVSI